MMKRIVMASIIALAAPAFAQTTDNDMSVPATNTGVPTPGMQDNMTPPTGQTPTTTTGDDTNAVPDNNMDMDRNSGPVTTDRMDTTGTMSTAQSATESNTGMGGPYEAARDYPVCSRTVTDNCMQTARSPRPHG